MVAVSTLPAMVDRMARERILYGQVCGLATGVPEVPLAILAAAAAAGWTCILGNSLPATPQALDTEVAHWQPDALLAYPDTALGDLRRFAHRGLAVATVVGLHSGLPGAATDPAALGALGAQYLVNRGATTLVWHARKVPHPVFVRRREAFQTAAQALGRSARTVLIEVDEDPEASLADLEDGTGILAMNDLHGQRLVLALARLGRHVPRQVQVLGMDDDVLACHSCRPWLSSIPQQWTALARTAVALLDDPSRGQVLVAPGAVVTRGTTAQAEVEDALVARVLARLRQDPQLNVSELARAQGVSRFVLERRFRAVLGRTPMQELVHARLEAARHCLAGGGTVAQACSQGGFANERTMRRVFLRLLGKPPSAWRGRSATE